MMERSLTLVGFEQSDTGIDDRVINGAELLLGVQFPSGYRRIALAFDGAFGDLDFPLPGTGRRAQASIGHWLSLIPWRSSSVWSWLACWGEHQLPRAVIPIAENGGGDLLCLDYRSGSEPSLCFWFHELGEDGLYPVAESFDSWLRTAIEPALS
ncbi:hypothetical protein ABIE51_000699 [Lysobacter sp. OAE881]